MNITDKDSSSEEEKTDLNVECAKLAVSISNNISKEVKTTVCGGVTKGKKSPPATKGRRTKKSSILGKKHLIFEYFAFLDNKYVVVSQSHICVADVILVSPRHRRKETK